MNELKKLGFNNKNERENMYRP